VHACASDPDTVIDRSALALTRKIKTCWIMIYDERSSKTDLLVLLIYGKDLNGIDFHKPLHYNVMLRQISYYTLN
jgi:hypothetical protein